MAQSVWSTRFISAYVNSTASSLASNYTVPVGKVAVVRCVSLLPDVAGVILVGRTRAGVTTYFDSTQGLTVNQPRTTDMRHVFEAGELIRTAWVSGGASVNVSGYLLQAT